jgi:hypothetical protein
LPQRPSVVAKEGQPDVLRFFDFGVCEFRNPGFIGRRRRQPCQWLFPLPLSLAFQYSDDHLLGIFGALVVVDRY